MDGDAHFFCVWKLCFNGFLPDSAPYILLSFGIATFGFVLNAIDKGRLTLNPKHLKLFRDLLSIFLCALLFEICVSFQDETLESLYHLMRLKALMLFIVGMFIYVCMRSFPGPSADRLGEFDDEGRRNIPESSGESGIVIVPR
jgi:hypothetical protein